MSIYFDIPYVANDNESHAENSNFLEKTQQKDRQMTGYPNFNANKDFSVVTPPSSKVARQTAAPVVHDDVQKLDQAVLETLRAAALDPVPGNAKAAMQKALSDGVSAEQLSDYYIPVIARELGDRWCDDNLSFANVTIGTSRLQFMLRELGANWSGSAGATAYADTILLIVPKEVYHTLGAVVLSGQLRRLGLSVKLILGGDTKDIARRVARTKYSAVFISSSRGETLESLRLIVDAVKTSTQEPTPVVIGGTILDVEPAETVTAVTGANYATKIPQEALSLCGLQFKPEDVPVMLRT